MTQTNGGHLSLWHLADPTTNAKGQKTCQLTCEHKPVVFQLGRNLKTRFGASSFDKTVDLPRKNLDFDITMEDNTKETLKLIDEWTIDYIYENQSRLIPKKLMSRDAIKENYKTLTSTYGSTTSIKTKINTRGCRTCLCFDARSESIELPEHWLDYTYDVQIGLPALYFMNGAFGWTVECVDLRLHRIENVCPF